MFRNEIAAVPRFQSGCGQARRHSPTILWRNCVGSGEVEKLDTLFCPPLQPCPAAPPLPPTPIRSLSNYYFSKCM